MFPIWESKVVSPMLSGHFSGSVVVTADLEKNMNSSSSRLKGKEKFLFIKLTISKASLSSLLKIQTTYNCFLLNKGQSKVELMVIKTNVFFLKILGVLYHRHHCCYHEGVKAIVMSRCHLCAASFT